MLQHFLKLLLNGHVVVTVQMHFDLASLNKRSASSNKHLGAAHVIYFSFSHLEKASG